MYYLGTYNLDSLLKKDLIDRCLLKYIQENVIFNSQKYSKDNEGQNPKNVMTGINSIYYLPKFRHKIEIKKIKQNFA